MKRETHKNKIHIGAIIKRKADDKGISATKLAEMIHRHDSTVHRLYEREWISTEQLWKISMALEYDFFSEVYGESLPENVRKTNTNTITIVISSQKISIEKKDGISKITEYIKIPD